MFGFFKKKQQSKTVTSAKQIEKEGQSKQQDKKKKIIESNKSFKQVQKASIFQRQDTQGQFVQKKRIKRPAQSFKKSQQQLSNNTAQTPKIQSKKNTKQLQQKDTQRPYKQSIQSKNNGKYQQSDQYYQNQQTYEDVKLKEEINLKIILMILQGLQELAEQQNELLISKQIFLNVQLKNTHNKLFYSKYFRFCKVSNIQNLAERYGEIIQSIEILGSKLQNRIGKGVHFHKNEIKNEEKLEKIYVSDQSEFLLFFKHFFSKPYTICNKPSTRKIIQVLWESISFEIKDPIKLYSQLKLWIYGISTPSNPTLIMLHKVILKNPDLIPKYAKMIYNDKIYMGINQTDPLIQTPLQLAAELSNKKSLQKLIKCGADPNLAPLYSSKGVYSCQYTQTKYKKHMFTLTFPQYNRKVLSPLQTLLFLKQDYNMLNDCLYFMELANIRKMRKQAIKIKQKLQQIPNCAFQISWKTYRGMLSFKQLPSDVITVYKKGSMLRIDYNIDSIQFPAKGRHYTLLMKAGSQKQLQFYEIRHHSKTILNKLAQIDMSTIKQRFSEFSTYPHSRNSEISHCKGIYSLIQTSEGKKISISLNINMQTQQVYPQKKKSIDYKKAQYKNTSQYEKKIFQSQIINYNTLQKSQVQSVIQETVVNQKQLPIKLKSKVQKSSVSMQIQFQEENINLKHIEFILTFFQADSPLIAKILKIFRIFENQDAFTKVKPLNYLPVLSKINLQKDLSLQIQIKNINYMIINDNIFNVECKVVSDMNYQENVNPRALDSLQQTMMLQEGYSINVSQFLGKTQKLLQTQDQYARQRFQRMLERESDNMFDSCFESGQNRGNILDQLQDDQD